MASSMLFCNHFNSFLSTPPLDYLSRSNTRKIPISSNKTFSSKLITRLKCSPVSLGEELIKQEEEFIKQEEELVIKHEEELIKQKKEFIKQEEELIKEEKEFIKQEEELIIKQEDKRSLQDMWREIQGCNNWEGLLDPMSSTLRNEIIRYGEFAQACYDAFDFDPYSKYCGTCKYESSQFFEKLEMENLGYQMRRYLYATSNINLPNFFQHSKITSVWSKHANWMGYVAVATDEEEIKRLGRRDIVVAWRGTVTYLEWIHDLKDILHPAYFCDDPKIKIESGFFDLYTAKEHNCRYASYSAREQILAEIRRLVEKYKNEKLSITITGHSLGAALALLSAYDIAEMKLNVKQGTDGASDDTIPITVFSFSGPRVGNLKFKERCDELNIKVLRVHNVHDKVPTVPGIIANEKLKCQKYVEEVMAFPWSYAHVGTEFAFDHKKSPFLRSTNDFGCLHNLEALLHLVDGYHGEGKEFRSVNKRDIALVNKCCNFLREEYDVPPHWRQDENKGMVRNKDGKWVLPERPVEAHPPDTDHHLKHVLKIAELPSSQGVEWRVTTVKPVKILIGSKQLIMERHLRSPRDLHLGGTGTTSQGVQGLVVVLKDDELNLQRNAHTCPPQQPNFQHEMPTTPTQHNIQTFMFPTQPFAQGIRPPPIRPPVNPVFLARNGRGGRGQTQLA